MHLVTFRIFSFDSDDYENISTAKALLDYCVAEKIGSNAKLEYNVGFKQAIWLVFDQSLVPAEQMRIESFVAGYSQGYRVQLHPERYPA